MPGRKPLGDKAMSGCGAAGPLPGGPCGRSAQGPLPASRATGAAARSDGATRWPSWWSCKATIRRGSMRCRRALPTARRRTRLRAICDLDLSELQGIEPPRGFGRD